jgi:putative ABC transport system permease protein
VIVYELKLLRASLRQRPGLSALMALSVAVGVACFVVGHGASLSQLRTPLPDHPRLRHVRFEQPMPNGGKGHREIGLVLARTSAYSSWADVDAVLPKGRSWRATATFAGKTSVRAEAGRAFRPDVRFCTHDFFAMFDLPLLDGAVWTEADDAAGAKVAVIDVRHAERLFGTEKATGRSFELAGARVRVVGVLAPLAITHVHDFANNDVIEHEGLYAPLRLGRELGVKPRLSAVRERFDGSIEALHASNTGFLQLWAEPSDAASARALDAQLDAHRARAHAAGRQLGAAVLTTATGFLSDYFDLASGYALLALYSWLALTSCVLGFARLMLAKDLAHRKLVGMHRALGASRRVVYGRLLLEATLLCLVGGVAGIGLAALGMWGLGTVLPQRTAPMDLDPGLVLLGLAGALACGLIGSAYPAFRHARTDVASLLRST